jgi:hypothetical protein
VVPRKRNVDITGPLAQAVVIGLLSLLCKDPLLTSSVSNCYYFPIELTRERWEVPLIESGEWELQSHKQETEHGILLKHEGESRQFVSYSRFTLTANTRHFIPNIENCTNSFQCVAQN